MTRLNQLQAAGAMRKAVGEMLENMESDDIRQVVSSNPKSLDTIIQSFGKDEVIWTGLLTKHNGMNNFFRGWHCRKLDQKK